MEAVEMRPASQVEKKLSCKRCQHRKLKCSRTAQCTNCTTAHVHCDYRPVDRKRTPASSEYAVSLERRVQSLERFISELQTVPKEERDLMLQRLDVDRNKARAGLLGSQKQSATRNTARDLLTRGAEGTFIYHGPSSILRSNPITNRSDLLDDIPLPDPASSSAKPDFEHVAGHFGIKLDSDIIMTGLQNFFKWQYPHFMFVYREAFLRDHFGVRKDCKYWSPALLMSICALGLLTSDIDSEREMSARCFDAAESIAIVIGFAGSSLVLVQAFLCLAFYEIGRGNLSKGWIFSGIAFRMAQDMGIQRDPKLWLHDESSLLHSEDIEIRRRVYWGCYNSDKLISLILGRPVQLIDNAAQVDLLNTIPDGPLMEYWRPAGFDIDQFGSSGVFSNIPYLKEQIKLSRIIESMTATVHSPQLSSDMGMLDTYLDQLNLELCRWKESLPDFARFGGRADSKSYPVPGVTTLHLLYHSIRIALNLDRALSNDESSAQEACRWYCTSSIQDIVNLIRNYRLNFGIRHSSLVLVYACAQALRAVQAFGVVDQYESLSQALKQCSTTWSLVNQIIPFAVEELG